MKINRIIIGLMLFFIVMPIATAELSYMRGEELSLKVPCVDDGDFCSNAVACQITIFNPDGNTLVNDQPMENEGSYFSYNLTSSQTDILGEYSAYSVCDSGTSTGSDTFLFYITSTGRERPNAYVVVAFSIIFLIILAVMIYTLFNILGHFLTMDTDIKDLAFSWITYFIVIAFYGLSLEYFGNNIVLDMVNTLMEIGIWTHMLLPLYAFILSITLGDWRKKRLRDGGSHG